MAIIQHSSALSLQAAQIVRYAQFRGYGHQHMHMIRLSCFRDYRNFLHLTKFPENLSKSSPHIIENNPFPIFRNKHNVVLAIPSCVCYTCIVHLNFPPVVLCFGLSNPTAILPQEVLFCYSRHRYLLYSPHIMWGVAISSIIQFPV